MLEILYYAFLVFLPTFLVTTLIALWLNPFWLGGSILKVVSILAGISLTLMIVAVPACFAISMFFVRFINTDFGVVLQLLPIVILFGGILFLISYFVCKAATKPTGKRVLIISILMTIYLISTGYTLSLVTRDPKLSSKSKIPPTLSSELCGVFLHRDDK